VARQYSGVCARHQRKLVKVIKQARHLGLLPFTTK
jgi:ribosomal protein S18